MRLRLGKWSWLIIGIGLLCVLGLLSERHSAGSQAGHAQMSRNRVAVRGGTLPLNEVAAVSSRGSPNSITSGNPSMAALQAKVAHLEEKLDGMLNQVNGTRLPTSFFCRQVNQRGRAAYRATTPSILLHALVGCVMPALALDWWNVGCLFW